MRLTWSIPLVLVIPVTVLAAEPTVQELQQQLDALQQQVTAMKPAANPTLDVDRAVRDVMDDASHRSKLLSMEGATAGYEKGFFIRSEDGKFLIKPGVWLQSRYVLNYLSDENDTEDGFELRRAWLRFDGNAFTPDFTYTFLLETSRSTGQVSPLDAYAQYKFADELAVKFGQFRESVFQERNVSAFSQLAVERSIADAYLGGLNTDRVQGFALVYGSKGNPLRLEGALHDGANSVNSDFQNAPENKSNWGAGARVDWKLHGDWQNARDFTAKGTREQLLVLGAGMDMTEGENVRTTRTTADAQYENPDGFGAYAAVHANFVDHRNPGASQFDFGAVGQLSYAFGRNWEAFGRIAWVKLDEDYADLDNFSAWTAGVNYYLGPDGSYMHRAKVTVDVEYLPDGAPADKTGLGVLATDDQELILRGQLQLEI